MLELTLVATPLVVGAVGYQLRRWFERRSLSEALKRKLQALTLYQGMKRAGLSLDDVSRIERDVTK